MTRDNGTNTVMTVKCVKYWKEAFSWNAVDYICLVISQRVYEYRSTIAVFYIAVHINFAIVSAYQRIFIEST